MKRLLVIGAGHIGTAIAADLAATGQYRVTLADQDGARLTLPERVPVEFQPLDARDAVALDAVLRGQDIVVSACPFYLNIGIAEAAKRCGAHYFDLTEDVKTTQAIAELALQADTVFVPQCGLAPGAIGIIGHHMALGFEKAHGVHMRVGALPLYPTNALKYNLTWSTDGLINEYCNPCEAVNDGKKANLLPLEGVEAFSLDGTDYEAFNTSGGLGTLCETLAGRVDNLDYKTIRYPGHRAIIKLLLHDLGLREDRGTLRRIFERAIPETDQDVVVMMVNAIGEKAGRLRQETFTIKVYGDKRRSAIQTTTAAGLCTMVDLFVAEKLPQKGFVRQEDARLPDFLANRFGRVFQPHSVQAAPLQSSYAAA
jgi:saccharopine dehydrogenase-like NADP-dependent oxidoreductase